MKFGIKYVASLLFGFAVFSVSLPANAVEPLNTTFYVGGGAGFSSVDTGVTATTGTAKLEEDDIGFKLFAGVNINEILSVEIFYAKFGETSLTGNSGDTFTSEGTTYVFTADNVKLKIKGSSFGIVPVFGYDATESFRPFVKVGIHQWDTDATLSSSAGNAALSDSGTDMIFGGGFMYKSNNNMVLRAEYERYKFDDDDTDFISVSAQVTF